MKITANINELGNIKDKLDNIDENDALLIEDDGVLRYAVVPIEVYELFEELNNMANGQPQSKVVLAGNTEELTYEEYEKIKSAVLETLEQQLKPKAEKMN